MRPKCASSVRFMQCGFCRTAAYPGRVVMPIFRQLSSGRICASPGQVARTTDALTTEVAQDLVREKAAELAEPSVRATSQLMM